MTATNVEKVSAVVSRLERRTFDFEMQKAVHAREDFEYLAGIEKEKRTPAQKARHAELRSFLKEQWVQEKLEEYAGIQREIESWRLWLTDEEPRCPAGFLEGEE